MQRGRIEARQPPDDRGGGRGVQNFRRDLIASARLGIDLPRTALGEDLLLMNASGFAIMLLDKNLARCHRRRVPEALLLAFAACFGSLGVLAGMYVCRHKTRKPLFTITVPLLLLAQCAILYFLFR